MSEEVVITNNFPGPCWNCGGHVPKGQGFAILKKNVMDYKSGKKLDQQWIRVCISCYNYERDRL